MGLVKFTHKENLEIGNSKTYWKLKKRFCARLLEVINSKSADRKAQISKALVKAQQIDLCVAICRFFR